MKNKKDINKNLPNQLTIFRIILGIIVIITMIFPFNMMNISFPKYLINDNVVIDIKLIICSFLFVIAAITDFLDGFIARKYELITDFGKMIDAIADKILVYSLILCFLSMNLLSVWIVILLLCRDFIIYSVRILLAKKNKIYAADIYGKIKTSLQFVSILIILLSFCEFSNFSVQIKNELCKIGNGCMILSVLFAFLSLLNCVYKNKSEIFNSTKEEE